MNFFDDLLNEGGELLVFNSTLRPTCLLLFHFFFQGIFGVEQHHPLKAQKKALFTRVPAGMSVREGPARAAVLLASLRVLTRFYSREERKLCHGSSFVVSRPFLDGAASTGPLESN